MPKKQRKYIKIRGANEHNLKCIDVDIPRDEFVVLTGLSGSGKSSLAFDTIYAEGQRRYMESLSSYARQFLGQMEKPDVESIDGLPPAISIDQKSTNRNPRSTVGTVTEIYDYFRLLYARIGIPHCPKCGRAIEKQTIDQMVDAVMKLPERTRIQILAPVVRGRKGEHQKLFEKAKKSGYVRVIVDGNMYELSEEIPMDKNIKHNIDIVVDRLVVKPGIEKRLTDSLENVFELTEGNAIVDVVDGEPMNFSQNFACPDCGISVDEVEPRSFSFNNPFGACPVCYGLGYKMEFDENLMIPDKTLSISEGAIQVMGWQSCTDPSSYTYATLKALSEGYGFSLDTPYKDLPKEIRHMLIHGGDGRILKVHYKGQRGEGVYDLNWEGLIKNVERRYRETGSDTMKQEYEQFMRITPCAACHGQRLKQSSLAVTVADKNIYEMTDMSVKDLVKYLAEMQLTEQQQFIGNQILKEIRARVGFLQEVGLDYLTLTRATGTLSGGEAQRIRLATQIGSGLVGVAYILDEPSIGLHQRDNDKLLHALMNLKNLGNTLIVVEHDEDTMRAADYIVDIGPAAGVHGGEVVATGTAADIMKCKKSITGAYLSGRMKIPVPSKRRRPTGFLTIKGARENNLKNIDVDIPRDEFVVLTGLSGSGKSSLAFDTIYAEGQRRYMESLSSYARQFLGQMEKPNVEKIEGLSPAISIDQKSTNRNPRSTVGTVTEIYDYFRLLYARIGVPHCPKCGKEIKKQTVDQMVDQIMELPERTKIQLLAPVVRGRKGEHQKFFEQAKRSGYVRVVVDGNLYELSEEIKLEKNKKHNIEIVVDRLMVKPGIEKRLTDSIENVLQLADGLMIVDVIDGEPIQFSESFSCPDCGISIDEVEPRSFSFNNPFGACPTCFGLGYKMEFDIDLMIPDKRLSISEGAIQVMGWQSCTDKSSFTYAILKALTEEYHFSLDTPFREYPDEIKDVLINGTHGKELKVRYKGQRGEGVYDVAFDGLIRNVQRRYRETSSETMKAEYEQFMRITPCEACHGQRLKPESLAVTVADKNIYEMTSMSVKNLKTFVDQMELTKQQHLIGDQILKEIRARVGFLNEVGLDYLSLSRATGTLSGGEAQRIKLATELSRRSTGRTIYILDEPTTGLHFEDVHKLVEILHRLADGGNTVVVIEHNLDVIKTADYIIDMGPEGGDGGGTVIAKGTPEEIVKVKKSYTGYYVKKMLEKDKKLR